ncbi:MAG: hypothetical protein FWF56_05055 [Firmicutes bacterium]|nr:hypothetical protein [Bacillota bacterium]MCL1954222.1 hypothetical protein [Bacillota bacterium]
MVGEKKVAEFYFNNNQLSIKEFVLSENVYIANFGPFVISEIENCERVVEIVRELSKSNNIVNINIYSNTISYSSSVKEEQISKNNGSSNVTLDEVIHNYIFASDTGSLNGTGITVGILEDNLVYETHPNLKGSSILVNHILDI